MNRAVEDMEIEGRSVITSSSRIREVCSTSQNKNFSEEARMMYSVVSMNSFVETTRKKLFVLTKKKCTKTRRDKS